MSRLLDDLENALACLALLGEYDVGTEIFACSGLHLGTQFVVSGVECDGCAQWFCESCSGSLDALAAVSWKCPDCVKATLKPLMFDPRNPAASRRAIAQNVFLDLSTGVDLNFPRDSRLSLSTARAIDESEATSLNASIVQNFHANMAAFSSQVEPVGCTRIDVLTPTAYADNILYHHLLECMLEPDKTEDWPNIPSTLLAKFQNITAWMCQVDPQSSLFAQFLTRRPQDHTKHVRNALENCCLDVSRCWLVCEAKGQKPDKRESYGRVAPYGFCRLASHTETLDNRCFYKVA